MTPLDQHRTAAMVMGAEPVSTWRPRDRRLAAVVDSVARVGAADVGLVLDDLRTVDPMWPWPAFVGGLLTSWDENLDAIDARRRLIVLGDLAGQAYAALDARVEALLQARNEAEKALVLANRAFALFEREARALDLPPTVHKPLVGLEGSAANDLERRLA